MTWKLRTFMAKKELKYKTFERSKVFTNFKKCFSWILTKKPKIVFRGDKSDFNEPTVFISNHWLDGTAGLYCNEVYFPFKFAPVGRFEVFLSFIKRWRYVYRFNHRLRRGLGVIGAWFAATFESFFGLFFYHRCRAIPSYNDMRSMSTFKMCYQCLDEGISLMIYPERLNHGYNNVFLDLISGFSLIIKGYFKHSGKEVKVCAVYYSKQTNQMIIDTPISALDMFNEGKTKEEISLYFAERMNKLYMDYVLPVHEKAEVDYRKKNKTDDILI